MNSYAWPIFLLSLFALFIMTPSDEEMAQIQQNKEDIETIKKEVQELRSAINSLTPRKITVTAYTARKEECDITPNKTASMKKPMPGRTIAVSRDLHQQGWSLGKRVYIDQIGVFQIEDLMHSKHENKIDVLLASVKEARQFGVKKSTAVLLD